MLWVGSPRLLCLLFQVRCCASVVLCCSMLLCEFCVCVAMLLCLFVCLHKVLRWCWVHVLNIVVFACLSKDVLVLRCLVQCCCVCLFKYDVVLAFPLLW